MTTIQDSRRDSRNGCNNINKEWWWGSTTDWRGRDTPTNIPFRTAPGPSTGRRLVVYFTGVFSEERPLFF